MLKKTPFYDMHVKHGGKIVPFAGFEMPVQFSGIVNEVKRVRATVGVFDVSHMGEIEVRGDRAMEFVSHITTNDPMTLEPDQVQYSNMLYEHGGIVDDLLVYNLKGRVLLVVNASNLDKDYEWIMKNKWDDVEVVNISDSIAQLAIQGPDAQKVVQKMTDLDLETIPFYWAAETKVSGVDMLISRTGYTGEDGFELYFDPKYAEQVWNDLFEKGKEFSIEPIGLGARDILRMEMRYMLYGNDITQDTSSLEAGLSWAVSMGKKEFIGKDALIKQKEAGLERRLCCFEMLERGIPRHEYKVFAHGDEVGFVTSGGFSPSTDKYIGMAYVKVPFNKSGNELDIDIRGKMVKGLVIKPPFYKNGTVKSNK